MTRDASSATPDARSEERGILSSVWVGVREVLIVMTLAMALSLLVKTFLVQPFHIPSGSMEDTLIKDDRVLVSKLTPGPFALQRGDIVVFTDPDHWLGDVAPVERSPLRSAFAMVVAGAAGVTPEAGAPVVANDAGSTGTRGATRLENVDCRGTDVSVRDVWRPRRTENRASPRRQRTAVATKARTPIISRVRVRMRITERDQMKSTQVSVAIHD